MSIRTVIVGVGNCAKSLVEGTVLYSATGKTEGLAFPVIGGYKPTDIEFVGAFDVDGRKVGKSIRQAITQLPNCAVTLVQEKQHLAQWNKTCPQSSIVHQGCTLDGIAKHMATSDETDDQRFALSSKPDKTIDEVVSILKDMSPDVGLIYLPVGSKQATRFYVEAFLKAKIPFVNCIPEFIVSDPQWGDRIKKAGIPAIGDDMRSQVGASVLSQVLQEMFLTRGATVKFHCQTNQGGNTDFFNMTDKDRLVSKKKSKENVITSQNDLQNVATAPRSVHAGPSDYIPYMKDNKVAHIRIEAEGFAGVPLTLDCRLSVQDSPNSAGVVIDAIRYLKVAVNKGMTGPLNGVSAFTQKTPPIQMTLSESYKECQELAKGV